ncbi:hypothetical protein [Winogradskyella sp.]|nr:hypothetical protein [Winogradskyella sp.]
MNKSELVGVDGGGFWDDILGVTLAIPTQIYVYGQGWIAGFKEGSREV